HPATKKMKFFVRQSEIFFYVYQTPSKNLRPLLTKKLIVKHLLFVRHAKSSWDDPSTADLDRPLNDRGEADAPMMAKRMEEKKIKLDVLVTSPAKRANQTCKHFAKDLGIKKKKIVEEQELYEAGPENLYHVIESFKK